MALSFVTAHTKLLGADAIGPSNLPDFIQRCLKVFELFPEKLTPNPGKEPIMSTQPLNNSALLMKG